MRGGAVFKKPEIMTVPWKDGEKAVKMRWDYHEKCYVKYGEKRWKTIVTVRHYGDRDSDGNHDGGDGNHDGGDGNHDGDGESSVTVGVNYGESGESDGEGDGENSITVGVNYGENGEKRWNNFHALSP